MEKIKIILVSVFIILYLHTAAFPTGPSSLKIKIKPVTYNDKGEILFKTLFEVNKTGAHRPMDTEYGWLVVSASGVWEEYLHRVSFPDKDIKDYELCQKEFQNDFNWDNPPASISPILERYKFRKRDKSEVKTKTITVSGKYQKSLNGIISQKISGNPERLRKMKPLFFHHNVALINNYYCDETKKGADFNLNSLHTNKYLNSEKEFIECYDIDGVFPDPVNFMKKGSEIRIIVENLYTLQVFATKDMTKAFKIVEKLHHRYSDAYVFKDINKGQILYKIRIGMKPEQEIHNLKNLIRKDIKQAGLGLYLTKINSYTPKLEVMDHTAKFIFNKPAGKRILLMQGDIKNNYSSGTRISNVMIKISFFNKDNQFIAESIFPAGGKIIPRNKLENITREEVETFFYKENVPEKNYIKKNGAISYQKIFFDEPKDTFLITTQIVSFVKKQS